MYDFIIVTITNKFDSDAQLYIINNYIKRLKEKKMLDYVRLCKIMLYIY